LSGIHSVFERLLEIFWKKEIQQCQSFAVVLSIILVSTVRVLLELFVNSVCETDDILSGIDSVFERLLELVCKKEIQQFQFFAVVLSIILVSIVRVLFAELFVNSVREIGKTDDILSDIDAV
jgi:hypothetical protein